MEREIFRSLKTIAEISISCDVTGQFFLRRGAGDRIIILYNNMAIYNPFPKLGLFDIFDGKMINIYRLQTGGLDLEYSASFRQYYML